MLLNLDLFKANPNAAAQSGATSGDGSMLEQIQTLNALGYLNQGNAAPANSNPPSGADEHFAPGVPPARNFAQPPASGDWETE